MRVLAAVLAATISVAPAQAHDSWINKNKLTDPVSKSWCCNEHDCEALGPKGIAEVTGGYWIPESQETIPHARVIWQSADGQWWRCRQNPVDRKSPTRCLIGPPPSI